MQNRKFLTLLTFILTISTLFSQLTPENTDFGLAKVGRQVKGTYVFFLVEPYYEYDYVATVDFDLKGKDFDENFENLVAKARRKYNYFNGLIVRNSDLSKADLIRFEGLKVSSGGIEIGSYVSFISFKNVYYGKVVHLDSKKEKASIDYVDIFDDKKVKNIKLASLNPLTESEFDEEMIKFQEKIAMYKFSLMESVKWNDKSGFNIGKIESLDSKKHKAQIAGFNEFGKPDYFTIDYLDLTKISESEYNDEFKAIEQISNSNDFSIGENVIWLKNNMSGENSFEIVEIDNQYFRVKLLVGEKEGKELFKWASFSDVNKL